MILGGLLLVLAGPRSAAAEEAAAQDAAGQDAAAQDAAATTPSSLPELGISLEAPEELVRQRDARLAAGAPAEAAELACRPFAEGLSLCFTWDTADGRRYVSRQDLQAWSASLQQAEAAVAARSLVSLDAARPEQTRVTDMDASYCLSMVGDGLDQAGWLHPARLVELCGSDLRVAVPARDVFLAWPGGDGDLDLVMAVGVARIHDASEAPVSTKAYRWDADEQRWRVWGQARPGAGAPPGP